MSSPRRRGRPIRSKTRPPRPLPPPEEPAGSVAGEPIVGPSGTTGPGAPRPEAGEPARPFADTSPVRQATRSQNRAAKRAATGVRPKGARGSGARRGANRRNNRALIGLVIGAVLVGAAVIAFGNPFGTPAASPTPGPTVAAGTCPTSPPPALVAGDVRTVTIETEVGTIVMRIDGSLAPNATGNFVALAGCGFYDGIGFHRLVPGFVIQGGDPDGDGSGGPGYAIQDDPVTSPYRRGTVAMARTQQPDTQGSQFFIVLSDDAAGSLTSAQFPYAILGEVTSGMDVVDAIAAMPNSGGQDNRALDPVIMTRVTVSPGTAPSAAPSTGPTAAPTGSAFPIASPTTTP